MQVTTKSTELLELLGKLKKVVPKRPTLPICSTVLLEAKATRMVATATDLEVALVGSCPAKFKAPRPICVPFRPLESFLKAVGPGNDITISVTEGNRVKVVVGNATATIEGSSANDFPTTPKVEGKAVKVYGLADAIKLVDYAMATEDSRPVLRAVCLNPMGGKVDVVAADGFRLTIAKVKGKLEKPIIVPDKTAMLVKCLMPGVVEIRQDELKTLFVSDGLEIVTTAVAGTYPNYPPLVPKGKLKSMVADVSELQRALKVVTSAVDSTIVRLKVTGNELVLSAQEGDGNQIEIKIPGEGALKIAFNPKYLADLLGKVDGKIILKALGPSSPGMVVHKGTTHVLMPMFVNW